MSDKKEILKTIRGYDQEEIGVIEIYNKSERGIENQLITLQDDSMVFGFVSALKLVRDTPLGEIEDLINDLLNN